MKKEFEGFKEGGRYLVSDKPYYKENLAELIVLEISEKAIKIQWYKKLVEWYLKDNLPFTLIEELPSNQKSNVIEDRSREIQFDDDMWCEKDEPQFTLKMTEENDIEVKLKVEEKPKLEWEQNPPSNLMTWDEAIEYAKTLGDGWRLPTKEELEKAYVGKVEEFYFRKYWSLSVAHLDNLNAWYVDFSDGVGHYYYKAGRVFVRCVREIEYIGDI